MISKADQTNKKICSETRKKTEILAPAGSPEALIAAIRGEADAVYLGAGSFNARRNAHNFDAAALHEAAAVCHSHGVKIYLTLNTLVFESELPSAISLAEQACTLGLDALILQDTGLAQIIHSAAPDMPLHASTQLSCHTPSGVRELKDMGFSRVILAREMTRNEIKDCTGQGVEIEIFVHGALCMSVSGQCYLSAMLGGRSGNRGLCAQPCRLPFSVGKGDKRPESDEKALSLKDLSLYDYVDELISLGVCSLKIEGRMKRPEYVAAAAKCFADARDFSLGLSGKRAKPQLVKDLQSVFSRSGFTSGYYTGKRGSNMFGARTYDDVVEAVPAINRLSKLYEKPVPRVNVEMKFEVKSGKPVSLTVKDCDGNFTKVKGEIPQTAVKSPLNKERAVDQLSKTGGTPFIANSVICDIEDGLTIPISALNAVRREALNNLLKLRAVRVPYIFNKSQLPFTAQPIPLFELFKKDKLNYIARFAKVDQIPEKADLDLIFVPLNTPTDLLIELMKTYTVGVEIPRGMFGTEQQIIHHLKKAADCGIQVALCGNIGALPLARQSGLIPIAGFGMNITNKDALNAMVSRGVAAAVLSQELTFGQMRFAQEASLPSGIIAYGRQPLMLLRNCPYNAVHGCSGCRGKGMLTDRRGIKFPLSCSGGCAELLNSVPLWLADKLDKLPPLDFLLLYFTDETRNQVENVISAYHSKGLPPKNFTRGLYKRGVD